MKRERASSLLFIVGIFILGFFYRFRGLLANHPFWVDEFNTASQALILLKNGIGAFTTPNIYFEYQNITTHALVALSFVIFGPHEWAARIPSVVAGSFVPIIVFILGRYLFDNKTAIGASLLTTFSYLQITWSRQARGYAILQAIVLLTIYFYLKIIKSDKTSKIDLFIFYALMFLGIITHILFYLLIISMIIHAVYFRRRDILTFFKKPWIYIFITIAIAVAVTTGLITTFGNFINSRFIGLHNNIWYYHSFLWREYTLITFLGVCGMLTGLKSKFSEMSLILTYLLTHFIFIGFVFGPYASKYTLVIFPLLFLGAGYSLSFWINNLFNKKSEIVKSIIVVCIILGIIVNGDKFVTKPKAYYSVNHDFREISNIDYNAVFKLIKQKGDLSSGETAIIDTWIDRPKWYLGHDYSPLYWFRWIDEKDIGKNTSFELNDKGEKYIPRINNILLIGELSDLEKAMAKYPKGFIFIDDSTLPHDVIEYAEKNLKKELYLDHYPLDDNPYSIWPATLYSWGID